MQEKILLRNISFKERVYFIFIRFLFSKSTRDEDGKGKFEIFDDGKVLS